MGNDFLWAVTSTRGGLTIALFLTREHAMTYSNWRNTECGRRAWKVVSKASLDSLT